MTSGEWDLRALKALEEEEQKEFLALSQKNLFEAPLPTGGPENGSISSLANAKPALSYAQLHPHLLKLPTIDECQLIAAKRQSAGSVASSARLKFTRALSLSAHSLSPRGGGGSGGGSVGFGKKLKARLVGAKSSGSLSPSRHSHSYSVSPVYTPPPIRRCATLHHTQPVRKTFKTLQQLERQKQKQSNASQAHSATASTPPQLQRIVGTNKTYWKYGANSTAASIIGQRARLQQQLDQDSNNSDEPNGDALEADALDSATETGSCSVPLPPADSNELLRLSLMLTAASTAMTATATATATATGGPVKRYHNTQSDVEDETVAYEAFHRPKSFERTLLHGASLTLTAQESQSPKPNRPMQSTNGKRILKSTSLEASAASENAPSPASDYQQQQIIGQPLGMMSLTTATNPLAEQQRDRECEWEPVRGLGQVKYHQDLAVACYGHNATLDDELEHHIKHCSCSCNHMGYGNSMDYQVSAKPQVLFLALILSCYICALQSQMHSFVNVALACIFNCTPVKRTLRPVMQQV